MDALSDDRLPRLIRSAIIGIVNGHPSIMQLALRQRAKFEGWLKFELAGALAQSGMDNVRTEIGHSAGRADVTFDDQGSHVFVELKTCATNFGSPGKNITEDVNNIISDVCRKLRSVPGTGIMAFVMFPFPMSHGPRSRADHFEAKHLDRIRKEGGLSQPPEGAFVPITDDAGLKVYAFAVNPGALPPG